MLSRRQETTSCTVFDGCGTLCCAAYAFSASKNHRNDPDATRAPLQHLVVPDNIAQRTCKNQPLCRRQKAGHSSRPPFAMVPMSCTWAWASLQLVLGRPTLVHKPACPRRWTLVTLRPSYCTLHSTQSSLDCLWV